MVIDWFKFAPALLLLLTPIALFHGKKVRYLSVNRDWDHHWKRILTLGLHTIDTGRATLGGWLLVLALSPDPGAHGVLRYSVLLTQGAVLCVAALLQTFFCKEPDSVNAPFAFVGGLVFGVYPPAVAGLPLLLAAAVAAGSRTPGAFFPSLAVSLVGLGVLFGGKKTLLLLICGACAVMLPWLCTLLFSREQVVTYRARRLGESSG